MEALGDVLSPSMLGPSSGSAEQKAQDPGATVSRHKNPPNKSAVSSAAAEAGKVSTVDASNTNTDEGNAQNLIREAWNSSSNDPPRLLLPVSPLRSCTCTHACTQELLTVVDLGFGCIVLQLRRDSSSVGLRLGRRRHAPLAHRLQTFRDNNSETATNP